MKRDGEAALRRKPWPFSSSADGLNSQSSFRSEPGERNGLLAVVAI